MLTATGGFTAALNLSRHLERKKVNIQIQLRTVCPFEAALHNH